MLPATSATLYSPPCPPPRPLPAGNRSLGAFGARPELLTTTEEFSNPVPFPLPTKILPAAKATADGYCPVGMKPLTLLRSSARRAALAGRSLVPELSSEVGDRATTATELL